MITPDNTTRCPRCKGYKLPTRRTCETCFKKELIKGWQHHAGILTVENGQYVFYDSWGIGGKTFTGLKESK